MATVRIYFKKQVRLDRLTFKQQQMFKITNAVLASVKNRVTSARGPSDGPAKPLSTYYAIRKGRLGLGNRRNLVKTGLLMRNTQVRTVSENKGSASPSGVVYPISQKSIQYWKRNGETSMRRPNTRDVGWFNQKKEPWLVVSPKNVADGRKSAVPILQESTRRLIVEKALA